MQSVSIIITMMHVKQQKKQINVLPHHLRRGRGRADRTMVLSNLLLPCRLTKLHITMTWNKEVAGCAYDRCEMVIFNAPVTNVGGIVLPLSICLSVALKKFATTPTVFKQLI